MYGHQYTEQEKQFMKDFVPGHSHAEIQQAFTEKFGWDITMGQVKSYISRNKLITGRDGRFQKGLIPHNKGMKGVCAAGCERTWFRKGNIPENHREVGSERITRDGYIEIKVAEPNVWKLKHRAVWEAEHGKVPDGYCLIFRDNNKLNTDIGNLILVHRETNLILDNTGLYKHKNDLKDIVVNVAELQRKVNRAKKRRQIAQYVEDEGQQTGRRQDMRIISQEGGIER